MAKGTSFISNTKSKQYFGNDAAWYAANVPMFECSDSTLEEVYHYRWKLYKAHIRDLGTKGNVITEFLDDVGWQKHPYAMLNDATGFHIYEGRWIRDRQYIDGFVDFLFLGGGNDRHFAESITDAAYAYYLVHGDKAFATKHLPAMRHIYNLWDDRYDFSKNLYFIEPLLDATEYTVSSIDASGGQDGFRGGDAFRPTINSYMVANARAIAHFSELVGDKATAEDYRDRADRLKKTIQDSLWNPDLDHFTDRYQVTNKNVRYWDFIRARELAGYVPWTHNVPDDSSKFAHAWTHLTRESEFFGKNGLRTIGPNYQYYMRQYRYLDKAPECQWNGPSWPFQTTQVLLGLANMLNGYRHCPLGRGDYLRLLQQYAKQHYLDGVLNLQEDYHPDEAKPIVGLDRSHHYNHSGFTDPIITGLCGLRPRPDNTLEVNPLIDLASEIRWFCLENVLYRGNQVTILWDADGTKYSRGKGLSVFVNGVGAIGPNPVGPVTCPISPKVTRPKPKVLDKALNIYRNGHPIPNVSSDPQNTKWQAVDGRAWFFPEMVRGWQPDPKAGESWFEIELESPTKIAKMAISFYEGAKDIQVPRSFMVQAWNGNEWVEIGRSAKPPTANTEVTVKLKATTTNKLRVVFTHAQAMCLVQLSAY